MLRIGEFAALCGITARTLRFYEENGLIKPSRIEPETGYRFYSPDLLPRVHRILVMRDLGLSLDQIGAVMVSGRFSVTSLKTVLDTKRTELHVRLETEQARLRRVEARLKQIEQEEKMPEYEVVIRGVPAQLVAGVRQVIGKLEDISDVLPGMFREVYEHISQQGAKPAGPWGEIWGDTKAFTGRDMDIEIFAPISANISESHRIKVHMLPAVAEMACVVHHGPYSELARAHEALHAWMSANGYKQAGPDRYIYYDHHRNGDPNDNVAEVQYPIAKAD